MIEKDRREYLIIRIMNNSVLRENGCREWIATKTRGGYGVIHFARQSGEGYKASMTAHRAHYQAFHNVLLTREQWVLHKCDNPSCVVIDHLFIGSAKDNSQDMIGKGRKAKKHKAHSRVREHSDDKIRAIRSATGPLKDVAELYGVSIGYVSKLRAGKAKSLVL